MVASRLLPAPAWASTAPSVSRKSTLRSRFLLAFHLGEPSRPPELSRAANPIAVTPFFAALTKSPQTIEKSATLSLSFATLTRCFTPKSFICHSYTKHPWWVCPSLCETSAPSAPQRCPFFSFSLPPIVNSRLLAHNCAASTSLNSFLFTLFRTLSPSLKSYLSYFQANPNSFCKTPGVGGGPSVNDQTLADPQPPEPSNLPTFEHSNLPTFKLSLP
jgi:hypothetical protein